MFWLIHFVLGVMLAWLPPPTPSIHSIYLTSYTLLACKIAPGTFEAMLEPFCAWCDHTGHRFKDLPGEGVTVLPLPASDKKIIQSSKPYFEQKSKFCKTIHKWCRRPFLNWYSDPWKCWYKTFALITTALKCQSGQAWPKHVFKIWTFYLNKMEGTVPSYLKEYKHQDKKKKQSIWNSWC